MEDFRYLYRLQNTLKIKSCSLLNSIHCGGQNMYSIVVQSFWKTKFKLSVKTCKNWNHYSIQKIGILILKTLDLHHCKKLNCLRLFFTCIFQQVGGTFQSWPLDMTPKEFCENYDRVGNIIFKFITWEIKKTFSYS